MACSLQHALGEVMEAVVELLLWLDRSWISMSSFKAPSFTPIVRLGGSFIFPGVRTTSSAWLQYTFIILRA